MTTTTDAPRTTCPTCGAEVKSKFAHRHLAECRRLARAQSRQAKQGE